MERSAHKLKTYSYFANQDWFPTEYEITTSQSIYYPDMSLSIKNGIQEWYSKYQQQSVFTCSNWNEFCDPSQYTYFKYISEKIEKTYLLQGLFEMCRTTRYYGDLSADWIKKLHLLYAPQIYPAHAMQMISSYIGQMAPSARIVITSGFQSANEISRIQTITENMEIVSAGQKNITEDAKQLWEDHYIYQPLRKLMEEALIIYDWGQAFVALNLCIKPILDEFFLHQFSLQALVNGDHLTSNVAFYKFQESEWQADWSTDLAQIVLKQNPGSSSEIKSWVDNWSNRTLDALLPLYDLFEYSQVNRSQLQQFFKKHISKLNFGDERII